MSRINKSTQLFTRALRDDEVTQQEAMKIARVIQKGGVSKAESKSVAAQLERYQDSFSAGARKILTNLDGPKQTRPGQAGGSGSKAATAAGGSGAGGRGGTIEDQAISEIGKLKEPKFPGNDASEAELAKFQKDLGKYNRMLEMYSKIMSNAHEMKKALINNLPRS